MSRTLFHDGPVISDRVIYTPSSFARTSLLYLQEVGKLEATQSHASHRGGLPSYLLFLVNKGSGTLQYDGISHHLESGNCVFIDCMLPYAHTPTIGNLWQLQWIHFSGASMHEIYAKYVSRGGSPVFSPVNIDDYSTLLSEILFLASADDYIRDMRINEKIAVLLTLIMSESWQPDNHSRSGLKRHSLHAIKAYLDEHYQEKITLDQLSEQFYINKFYLTHVFHEQFGTTILAYLDHVRVSHAKHLLRFSSMTVEEIGAAVGINESGYFNRVFKKVEGVTPGEYRKMW